MTAIRKIKKIPYFTGFAYLTEKKSVKISKMFFSIMFCCIFVW